MKRERLLRHLQIGGSPYESNEAGIITVERKETSLAVDTLYNPQNERRSSMEEIWTLSADGNTLTDTAIFHPPSAAKDPSEVRLTRVFKKQ